MAHECIERAWGFQRLAVFGNQTGAGRVGTVGRTEALAREAV